VLWFLVSSEDPRAILGACLWIKFLFEGQKFVQLLDVALIVT